MTHHENENMNLLTCYTHIHTRKYMPFECIHYINKIHVIFFLCVKELLNLFDFSDDMYVRLLCLLFLNLYYYRRLKVIGLIWIAEKKIVIFVSFGSARKKREQRRAQIQIRIDLCVCVCAHGSFNEQYNTWHEHHACYS